MASSWFFILQLWEETFDDVLGTLRSAMPRTLGNLPTNRTIGVPKMHLHSSMKSDTELQKVQLLWKVGQYTSP